MNTPQVVCYKSDFISMLIAWMVTIDSHLVLENNTKMRSEYERIGCKVVKKFRIYQKDL